MTASSTMVLREKKKWIKSFQHWKNSFDYFPFQETSKLVRATLTCTETKKKCFGHFWHPVKGQFYGF